MDLLTYRRREATTHIIVHDTHTLPAQSHIEHYLAVKGRTMGLLEVGYHYIIRTNGLPFQTRPHDTVGAHCAGYNRVSIGIAMAGGAELDAGDDAPAQEDTFSRIQKQGLVSLIGYLMDDMGYGREVIVKGHTELPRYRDRDVRCPAFDMEEVRNGLHGTR